MAEGDDSVDVPKLSELFEDIWETYTFIDKTTEATNSDTVQVKVHHGIAAAEKAVMLLNDLQVFSTNEQFEEVTTTEVRYLLLPALLGFFTGMVSTTTPQGAPIDRMEIVKKSQVYYQDFLRLCRYYGLTDKKTEREDDDESETKTQRKSASGPCDLAAMSRQREAKLARFRKQQATEARLKELYEHVKREHVDDATRREYYKTLLERWIQNTAEALESIDMEMPLLEHMAKLKDAAQQNGDNAATTTTTTTTRKQTTMKEKLRPARPPFIITKDRLQKSVFGAGYPSLPVLSVEEFYEQQVRDGLVPQPNSANTLQGGANSAMTAEQDDAESAQKERLEETDDAEALAKARQWDDWKDDHRRGWGNTKNQG